MKAIIYTVGLIVTSVAVGFDTQSIPRAFECIGAGLMLLAIVSTDSSAKK